MTLGAACPLLQRHLGRKLPLPFIVTKLVVFVFSMISSTTLILHLVLTSDFHFAHSTSISTLSKKTKTVIIFLVNFLPRILPLRYHMKKPCNFITIPWFLQSRFLQRNNDYIGYRLWSLPIKILFFSVQVEPKYKVYVWQWSWKVGTLTRLTFFLFPPVFLCVSSILVCLISLMPVCAVICRH